MGSIPVRFTYLFSKMATRLIFRQRSSPRQRISLVSNYMMSTSSTGDVFTSVLWLVSLTLCAGTNSQLVD
ncbi:hypothetical protein VTO42DRAFT_8934 [Malbranchea cinnamomea]